MNTSRASEEPSENEQRGHAANDLKEISRRLELRVRLLETTLSHITDFAYILDREGRFVYVNQALLKLWGLSLDEAVGKNFFDLRYPDDLAARLQQQIDQVFDTRQGLRDETAYTSPTGVSGYYEYIFSPVVAADGTVEVVAGSTRDISERKRTARLLDAQNQALEMLVSGSPLAEVLTYLALIVERHTEGEAVASILLLDEQGCLRNGASPSLPEEYVRAIDGLKAEPDAGTCSAAAARGAVVVTPDIATDPTWQDLKHLPLALGFQAAWSMPIMSRDGRVLGTLGTYFRERREPLALERQVVEILTRTAALAIERQQTEAALRKSEEWVRAIFDASRDGILVEDNEQIVYVNKAYADLFGYDATEELIGRHVSVVISQTDSERMLKFGRQRTRGELPTSVYEFKGQRKDGTLVDVEASVSTSIIAGHAYITTMIRDIAERKQAQAALSNSEARYRLLFDSNPLPLWVYDLHTLSILAVNEAAVQHYGYARAEFLALTINDIQPPENIPLLLDNVGRLSVGRQLSDICERHRKKDGTIIDVEITAHSLTFEGRAAEIVLAHDVTGRRQAETALLQAHDELEQKVAARTVELADINTALQSEIRERSRAEEARWHLLRQLVTAQEDERRRISLELHDQMGQHIAATALLVNSLKALRQWEAPAESYFQQLEEVTTELSQQVERLSWELRPTALDDLGLQTALSNYAAKWSELSHVPVEFQSIGLSGGRLAPQIETAIYRIVQEALTNIIKHAQANYVSLILERRDEYVSAIIEDDGCGFDVEVIHAAPAGEHRLGLLGMQERAALVGGTLNIEATPGVGTTIFVRVPTGLENKVESSDSV